MVEGRGRNKQVSLDLPQMELLWDASVIQPAAGTSAPSEGSWSDDTGQPPPLSPQLYVRNLSESERFVRTKIRREKTNDDLEINLGISV